MQEFIDQELIDKLYNQENCKSVKMVQKDTVVYITVYES